MDRFKPKPSAPNCDGEETISFLFVMDLLIGFGSRNINMGRVGRRKFGGHDLKLRDGPRLTQNLMLIITLLEIMSLYGFQWHQQYF